MISFKALGDILAKRGLGERGGGLKLRFVVHRVEISNFTKILSRLNYFV